METYKNAKQRLLGEFAAMGFKTSNHSLKIPWVEPFDKQWRLWFRPQAIYLNNHSLFIDMRETSAKDILEYIKR